VTGSSRYRARIALALAFALTVLVVPTSPASAAPVWPTLAASTSFGGLPRPTNIVSPGDGTDRLFVTEQSGVIRLVQNGSLVATPVLDIHTYVLSSGHEQGLLGLVFPPGFATKHYVYIYFVNTGNRSVVYRVRFSATDPDRLDWTTRQLVLEVAHPYSDHYAGQLAFGPDGYLYVGLGDGGKVDDPGNRAQNLGVLLGKIVRLSVESSPAVPGYSIPPTNPFVGKKGVRPEIWAYGLRNPWRFSFDPAQGDLWIGDVGEHRWEEIDRVPAGSRGGWDFGWPLYEGSHLLKAKSKARGFVWPVAEYSHSEGEAVMGGYVYRGSAYPRMQGIYYFGDYAAGKIWGLKHSGGVWVRKLLIKTSYTISTFGVDKDGGLWVADWAHGRIHKLVDTGH